MRHDTGGHNELVKYTSVCTMHVKAITIQFKYYNSQHVPTMYISILRYRPLNVVNVVRTVDSDYQKTCDGRLTMDSHI